MKSNYPFLSEILEKYNRQRDRYRFLVGIVGAPAAGKSYLAERLPTYFNQSLGTETATHFNMDAYHRYDAELYAKGIYDHKGAHFTFDVEGFIAKLIEIKEKPEKVLCPIYDRSRSHDPIQDAHAILPQHRAVFVEGNYLLSTVHPWISIRHILDYCIFVEVDEAIQIPRLLDRHISSGKNPEEAERKVYRTDIPNAHLIRQGKSRADYVYQPEVNIFQG